MEGGDIMTKLVIGAFPDREDANEAILELEEAGVPKEDFSVIGQEDAEKTGNFTDTAAESTTGKVAGGGAAVGGVAGGLAGLIAGAVATAGMFIAGPVVLLAGLGWVALATVTGGAVGAAAGGIVGALVGLGIPEETAKHHESVIKAGGVLLGVDDHEVTEEEIRECFEEHGAEQIATITHENVPARVAALVA